MELCLSALGEAGAGGDRVEIVERKGLGHPDSICDAVAEAFSRALCHAYLECFGSIEHHNVDKVLLRGGASRPAFGAGRVLEPIELYLAGRATTERDGASVPVEEIAVETCRGWLRENLHALDAERHVRIRSLVRPGSQDLVELYARARASGRWLANDTSCGVGYAPLTGLERVVDAVERRLSGLARAEGRAAVGEDVKVMGVRTEAGVALTIGCALVGGGLRDLEDYRATKAELEALAVATAREQVDAPVTVVVNAADDPEAGSVYLTVTGTSAEAGDDGEAGRGNRLNGLITPGRPTTLESVAGKNPVTHVGKLYNVVASLAAQRIVGEIEEVEGAECLLVSRIGGPVDDPAAAQLRLRGAFGGAVPKPVAERAREALTAELERLDTTRRELVDGTLAIDRWPLRR